MEGVYSLGGSVGAKMPKGTPKSAATSVPRAREERRLSSKVTATYFLGVGMEDSVEPFLGKRRLPVTQ